MSRIRVLLAALACAAPCRAAGRLVLVGGGEVPEAALARCLEGGGRRVLVVPHASEDRKDSFEWARELFNKSGASEVSEISGDPRAALEQIERADVIWFGGGDQNRITASYAGTVLQRAMIERLKKGAVIGGTSAGAAMAGDVMITGEGEFDRIAPGAAKTAAGMGFLRGTVVDQHFLRRKRFNRLISALLEHPGYSGLAVDEDSAVEVSEGKARLLAGAALVLKPDGKGFSLRLLPLGVEEPL